MEDLANQILVVADWLTLHVTVQPLVEADLFLAVTSRAVQLRYFPSMIRVVTDLRQGVKGGISSFWAFVIFLVARVGVGNVFGVAAALLIGGSGAIPWMWIITLVGMATVFLEAALTQMFKVRAVDGSFRGSPAYYISLGMKSKALTTVFVIITVVTCAFVITSAQSSAIVDTVLSALSDAGGNPALWGLSQAQFIIAALLSVLSMTVIFGGIRIVVRVTGWVAPIMATICVIMVTIIVVANIDQLGMAFAQTIRRAAAPAPIVGGLGGGISAVLINGTECGLFSNEADQGTVSNAAATMIISHPVTQRFIQSLGAFTDTVVVRTAIAFVILIAGPEVWGAQDTNSANLTSLTVTHEFGAWAVTPTAISIFILAYSSIIAAYVCFETNMTFVSSTKWAVWNARVVSVFSVALDALASLDLVWNTINIAMVVMTATNLVALLSLSERGHGTLRDYKRQCCEKVAEPVFSGMDNPLSSTDVSTDSRRG